VQGGGKWVGGPEEKGGGEVLTKKGGPRIEGKKGATEVQRPSPLKKKRGQQAGGIGKKKRGRGKKTRRGATREGGRQPRTVRRGKTRTGTIRRVVNVIILRKAIFGKNHLDRTTEEGKSRGKSQEELGEISGRKNAFHYQRESGEERAKIGVEKQPGAADIGDREKGNNLQIC